ncbi:MAG TPA: PQQ-binding-like beta-propeller repeat protein [Burkholderiales bacterium]|nr:PQQ-binding-like beta-propeller repeat protein [Burkholderiales bacterium]
MFDRFQRFVSVPVLAIVTCFGVAPALAVDDSRLTSASNETTDWLTYGHTYENQRFSALDQINRDNVTQLVPRWIYQTGISATFLASPVVADGVMYVSTPRNDVVALDAVTGAEKWRYRHQMKTSKLCCGPANRGVSIGYGAVYMASADARLIALDMETGAVIWDIFMAVPDEDPTETVAELAKDDPYRNQKVTGSSGLGANMAPLVFDGMIIAGVTGAGYGLHVDAESGEELGAVIGFQGSFGRRGYLAAYDAESGEEIWRWYTTKADGWEGEWRTETPDGAPLYRDIAAEKSRMTEYADAWKVGGGSLWSTPALDSELGLLYLGTGNPAPQMDDVSRPGDNLYTLSVVALDARTGKLRWYYQQVPHDLWGYDVGSPPVLFDVEHKGRTVKAVGEASKTGWFYVNDRVTGELLFKSENYVPHRNIFRPPTEEGVTIAPGAAGGTSWSPVSFDPATGLAYIAGLHMPTKYTVRERPASNGKPAVRYSKLEVADEPRWGILSAIDTRAQGKIRWQTKTKDILIGGVLATSGGLVFMGQGTGEFSAFDSATGEHLWSFNCGAGVNAPPITYEIDGTQYVTVAAGGHNLFGFPRGNALMTFALPGK